jgi:hypothetical protein
MRRDLILGLLMAVGSVSAAQSIGSQTLREMLIRAGSPDVSLLPDSCLDAKVVPQNGQRYIHAPCRIGPSSQQLFVFALDGRLQGSAFGWELVTLPNDFIVYHDSETLSAATHPLGISVFDPATGNDKKIYPPLPYQPVRQAFIDRVAGTYRSRNESVDPAQFDSQLEGNVQVETAHKTITFDVRYGDPNNRKEPLPFTQFVTVTCGPIDSLERMHCVENAGSHRPH